MPAEISALKRAKRSVLRLVPSKARFALQNLVYGAVGGFKRHHYSQFGEDIILECSVRLPATGTYVDVGAHHPKRYSNTFMLFKKGWRGINIDPNPLTCQMFRKARPNDVTLEVGVGRERGELTYFMFSDPAVNTFSEEHADQWAKSVPLIEKRKIEILPLAEILEKNLKPGQRVDLLDVDAEGMDLDVLKSNDWEKFRPGVLVVEIDSFDAADPFSCEIFAYLHELGYSLRGFSGLTGIFADRRDGSAS